MSPSARAAMRYAGVALGSFGAVAVALFTQYHWNMQPCPWCVLQRLIYLAMGSLAVLAVVLPARALRGLLSALIAALGASGVAAALWQHFVAAKSASCNLTLADRIVGFFHLDTRLPAVFEVRANCADAAVNLFGLPYEIWSLLLFVALSVLALVAGREARRTGR